MSKLAYIIWAGIRKLYKNACACMVRTAGFSAGIFDLS